MTRRRLLALALLGSLVLGGLGVALAVSSPDAGRVAASGSVTAVGAPGARTGVDDFHFASFDAVYRLDRDAEQRSTLHTTEHLVAVFPDIDQNRGIRRAIPAVYDGHATHLEVISVTDTDGTPRPYTSKRDGDFLVLTIALPVGWYVHGEQHYVIEYTERDVTRFFADTGVDEFYRDVNGTGWAQPFTQVTARLEPGPVIAAAATGDASCYRGSEGATTQCPIARDGTAFTAGAENLGAGQNLTIAVAFREGTFAAAPFDPFALVPPLVMVGLGIAFVTTLGAVGYRILGLRGAKGRGTIVAWYEPPEGVSVPLAANLIGVPQRAFTASILDLAVRGKLRVLHDEPSDAYGVRLLDGSGLGGDERLVVGGLFWSWSPLSAVLGTEGPAADAGVRWFPKRDRALGLLAASVRKNADALALSAGLRRKPPGWPAALVGLGLLAGFLVLVAHAIMANDEGVFALTFAVGLNALIWVTLGCIHLVTGQRPLTSAGAQLVEHLHGLREYIRLAVADRLRMLQSATGAERLASADGDVVRVYERLLPYAVLFGLEKEWQAVLASSYGDAGPSWVEGGAGSSTILPFAFHLASVPGVASASSSWGTSSGSSSSGGSSGGGSSGGGGGGGGGGGV